VNYQTHQCFPTFVCPIWAYLRAILDHWKPCWSHLGPLWGRIHGCWVVLKHLEPGWGGLRPRWVTLKLSWTIVGSISRPSCAYLGAILSHPGTILRPYWAHVSFFPRQYIRNLKTAWATTPNYQQTRVFLRHALF
jgi:hypothetical protein